MKAHPTPYDTPIAPRKLKLLVTVVAREKAEFYTDLLQSFEVNFQTAMAARKDGPSAKPRQGKFIWVRV